VAVTTPLHSPNELDKQQELSQSVAVGSYRISCFLYARVSQPYGPSFHPALKGTLSIMKNNIVTKIC